MRVKAQQEILVGLMGEGEDEGEGPEGDPGWLL